MSIESKLEKVRDHLKQQADVHSARIVRRGSQRVVRAVVINQLGNRETYSRTCYYDEDGTLVSIKKSGN